LILAVQEADFLVDTVRCGVVQGPFVSRALVVSFEVYVVVDHPPYSPDLASSDFRLFPGMKKQLNGK
jgi:hypothetical protein